jgi:hypothetical protein
VSAAFTDSEHRFAAYLNAHGYDWQYEPDYQAELELEQPLQQHPDFLVSRGATRVVCEVRQFDLGSVDRKLAGMKSGVLSEKDVYGRARLALIEKARQLESLADSGLPLVIVLSNPLGAFVPMDFQHMTSVLFGNPKWTIPIDTQTGGAAGPGQFIVEDYGAFISLFKDEQGERFIWRHPHVSAVATLHHRTHEQDFIDQVMARYPADENSFDAAARAAFAALQEVNSAREKGLVPDGEYQWLEVYELDGASSTPLPRNFFAGPRDTRHGFLSDDGYGEIK